VTPPTVAFATLGCRVNQADTQELQALCEGRGFRMVPFDEPADVVVVNTCTVTARAEFSDRQIIRRAGRLNPRARVVVTGCWAQTSPEAVSAVGGVDLVVGNADKHRLPDLLGQLLADDLPSRVAATEEDKRLSPPPMFAAPLAQPERSRAFLKIQDGCQHRCAFCIVPLARGASRSVAPAEVVERVRRLVAAGHPEVVLTGIDLGHYGAGLSPRASLAGLLRRLERTPGLRWIRLSSLLPAYVTSELFDVLAGSPVVAPHFHLPLQSGSERVLRLMRRPYTIAMFRRLVERLAAAVPRAGIGTDLIAGFPGETDQDAQATLKLVEALPLSYLHVFPYSARAGTEAAGRPNRLEAVVVTDRTRALRRLGEAKSLAFRQRLVGGTEEVLVLDRYDPRKGVRMGLTGNYVEIAFPTPAGPWPRLARARVTGVDGPQTFGQLAAAGASAEERG
jgi:threonylcarbamoyladenosine tRNA methylthiotransferase MtaB